ncbi:MAG TPA: hypothetical protein VIU41_12420 [Geobacteraceae bacterium]
MRRLFVLALLAAGLSLAAAAQRPLDLEQRQVNRLVATCRFVVSQLEGEVDELGRAVAAITPLEPQRREDDLRSLQDWYYATIDLFRGALADLEGEQALLQGGAPAGGRWPQLLAELSDSGREQLRELQERTKGFDKEEKRLAEVLDRRNLLLGRSRELEERLSHLEGVTGERQQDKLRGELRVVQNELLSLPDVTEDILKHYRLLAEWARGESDQFALHLARLEALQGVAGVTGRERRRDREAVLAAYQRLLRNLEGEAERARRQQETPERKRERLTPAGTIREVDRGRDLANLYERFGQRYRDLQGHLTVLMGEIRYEIGEASGGRGE